MPRIVTLIVNPPDTPVEGAKPDDADAIRRFTRLTNVSKKIENHAMVALYFMYYDFGRAHQLLRTRPAMEPSIADQIWSIEGIVPLMEIEEIAMSSDNHYRDEQDKLFKNLGLPGLVGNSDDELIEAFSTFYLSQHKGEVTDEPGVERWAVSCLMDLHYGKARSEAIAAKIRRRVVWADFRRRKPADTA